MIPQTMTAIGIREAKGDAGALYPETVPVPRPGPGEILIHITAAGVNRPDVQQRLGLYPPPPGASPILGLEGAGVVVEVGSGACRWSVGDRVTALLPGGGYADYAVADARHALPIPGGLDLIHAAALPETVFTVFANVFELGGLKPGQTLLVHGANSGIGLTAVALARAAGARVIATGRGAAKLEQARALGADRVIDVLAEDYVAVVKGAGGADVSLNMIGGGSIQRDIEALNRFGRLVIIATQAGGRAEARYDQVMVKRLTITGSTLRPRDKDDKARLAAAVEATVWPWIEAGQFHPLVGAVFPLAEAARAHAWIEGDHVGKVILATAGATAAR